MITLPNGFLGENLVILTPSDTVLIHQHDGNGSTKTLTIFKGKLILISADIDCQMDKVQTTLAGETERSILHEKNKYYDTDLQ